METEQGDMETWIANGDDPNMVCVEDVPDHLQSILDYYRSQSQSTVNLTDISPGNFTDSPPRSFGELDFGCQIERSLVAVSAFIGVNRMVDCSGVVYDESGLILTSAKVLRFLSNTPKRFCHIMVRFFNGEVLQATEEHVDFYLNFALLKVQPTDPLQPIKFVWRKKFSEYQWRITVLGRKFFNLSSKQVDGVLRSHPPSFGCDGLLSSTCRTDQACEGGPIIARGGEVIGMSFVDDTGFAHLLPSYCLLSSVMTWKSVRRVMYPWFGLTVIGANNVLLDTRKVLGVSPANKRQLLVKHVYSGCLADELKILPGDRVISFDGNEVFESQQYSRQLLDTSNGMSGCSIRSESTSRVELEIQRRANGQTLLVAAENLPSTDRKFCIFWPSQEEIWLGEPLEGSQKAPVQKSFVYKPASLVVGVGR